MWTDADRRFDTSTVTFDFFYTARRPPTAPLGVLPFGIEGRPIAIAVDEVDLNNRVVWNTTNVPAGSYSIWSLATEEPPDLPVTMVMFSRGVVTIAHPGDPVYPAVLIALEQERTSKDGFLIPYEAFDPTGTASITLSVSRNFDGTEAELVGVALPAVSRGEHWWAAEGFAPGRYAVRAKISDARGLSFVNYAPFYLRVDPNAPPSEDSGVADSSPLPELDLGFDADELSPSDAHLQRTADAGSPDPDGEGCGCQASPSASVAAGVIWLALLVLRRRRPLPRAGSRSVT